MGHFSDLFDRIKARVERPADQSVLDAKRNHGSESMIRAESKDEAVEAGRRVRRERARRRWRWGSGGS